MKFKIKKPKVTLINSTKDPIETMCFARRVMHSPVPDSLEELKSDPNKWLGADFDDYINNVLFLDGMPTFLEYVNLTFKLENVSRAMQTQFLRHRIGFSFSIQSMRCIELPKFATNGEYHNPFQAGSKEEEEYHKKMLTIESEYNKALKEGISMQDARGLLPLNIYSTITFSCSLRALIGMVNKRSCFKVQGEAREVASLIIEEIKEKIDPRIMKWIGPPCQVQGYCMMEGENRLQLKENKLKGKQNTEFVCPTYLKLFGEKNEN